MALDKQNFEVPFIEGLDQGIDAKLVRAGKLQNLQDGFISAGSLIARRSGYVASGQTAYSGENSLGSNAVRFHRYKELYIAEGYGGQLSSFDGSKLKDLDTYHSDAVQKYQRKTNRATLESEFVAPGSYARTNQAKNLDVAYSGSTTHLSCFAWEDAGTFDCRYLVRDENTKQILQQGTLRFPSAGTSIAIPRVIYLASISAFGVYYFNETVSTIERILITVAAPTTFTGPETVGSGTLLVASGAWDLFYERALDAMLFSYEDAANDLHMERIDTANGFSLITASAVVVSTAIRSVSSIIVDSGGSNYYVTAWADEASNNIYVSSWANAVNAAAPTTTTQAVGHTPGTIDTIEDPLGHVSYYVVYEQKTINPNMHMEAFLVTASTVAIASGPRDIVGGCRLAGKCFVSDAEDRVYATVQFANSVQRSAFVIDVLSMYDANLNVTSFVTASGVNPPVLARLFPETCGAIPNDSRRRLPTPFQLNSSSSPRHYTIPCIVRKELEFANSVEYADNYIALAHLDFNGRLSNNDLAPGQYMHGACPLYFDGDDIVEAEFNTYPVISTIVANSTGALAVATAYSFILVYSWQDSSGRVHRSIPSEAVSFTTGGADTGAQVNFYDQLLTRRQGVRIELYRTKAAGTVYFKDPAATIASGYVLTIATDAQLGELLYTEGGTLEHAPTFNYGQGCTHQGRVMSVAADRASVWYSDQDQKDQPPNFSEEFKLFVPGDRGKITALHSMDERLIVFCERGIYVITGYGPSTSGVGGSYSDAVLIEGNLGCKEGAGNSLVPDPEGVWFYSSAGIRHLNRGLSLTRMSDGRYAGAEPMLMGTCIKALSVPGNTQLRFFDGTYQWVYDYKFKQWAQWTNFAAVDAEVSTAGKVYHLKSTATIYEEQDALTIDPSSSRYSMYLESPWYKFGAIQGFHRVYRLFLIADSLGDTTTATQTLNIKAYVNYDSSVAAVTKTVTFASLGLTSSQRIIQVDMHMPVQKCESVKFEIYDTSASGTQLNYKLFGLKLQVGFKRGGPKLAVAGKI